MTGRNTGDVCRLIAISLARCEGTIFCGDVEEGRLLWEFRGTDATADLTVGLGKATVLPALGLPLCARLILLPDVHGCLLLEDAPLGSLRSRLYRSIDRTKLAMRFT